LTNATTDVVNCMNITVSNGDYSLTGNLVGNQTRLGSDVRPCLDVQANNVTIDCAGFTITGNVGGSPITAGIFLNFSNDTEIINCDITNYSYGIRAQYSENGTVNDTIVGDSTSGGLQLLQSSTGWSVDNVTLYNNTWGGIVLESSSGNATVTNSFVNDTASGPGVNLNGASYNQFNNTICNNNYRGFNFVGSSSNNNITYSVANQNAEVGIGLDDNSNNNRFENNEVTENIDGIYEAFINGGNNYTNNNVSFNTNWDFKSDEAWPSIIINMTGDCPAQSKVILFASMYIQRSQPPCTPVKFVVRL